MVKQSRCSSAPFFGIVFFIAFCCLTARCAHDRTNVFENDSPLEGSGVGGAKQEVLEPVATKKIEPLKVSAETVIVDARGDFEFQLSRVAQSIQIKARDLNERDSDRRNLMTADIDGLARVLARRGISPEQSAIVFGEGPTGRGEEGRVAWVLGTLGFQNVKFARMGAIRLRMTNVSPYPLKKDSPEESSLSGTIFAPSPSEGKAPQEKPRDPVAAWTPSNQSDLRVEAKEISSAENARVLVLTEVKTPSPSEIRALAEIQDQVCHRPRVIGRVERPCVVESQAWRSFFDKNLRPQASDTIHKSSLLRDLKSRLWVIDADGIAGAAVVMALRELGYERVGLIDGGWSQAFRY